MTYVGENTNRPVVTPASNIRCPKYLPKGSSESAEAGEDVRMYGWQDQPGSTVLFLLDHIGCGYLALDDAKRVVEANATAYSILKVSTRDRLNTSACFEELSKAFKHLISLSPARRTLDALTCVIVSSKQCAPLILSHADRNVPEGKNVVMLIDLDSCLYPNPLVLQRMFGLTPAETRLALQLAQGDIVADIARKGCLSRTTIRSQLASVFAKTQTTRQAELVKLLTRVAVLP